MRKFIVFIIANLFSFCLLCQCPPLIDINLYSQDDVNIFSKLFPECTIIQGNLRIMSFNCNDQINSLEGLKNIIEINGNLEIANNPALKSINALKSLRYVNGEFLLSNNYKLNSLSLRKLNKVGKLIISDNENLKKIELLDLLIITNRFYLGQNEELTDLIIPNLKTVKDFGIKYCSKLKHIMNFKNLISLQNFYLACNHSIEEINFLPLVKKITESIYIDDCSKIKNLDFLMNVVHKVKNISIVKCNKIVSINLPLTLDSLENFSISQNEKLNEISGASFVGPTLNTVSIQHNESLNTLNIFNSVESLDNLTIEMTPLQKINCFPNIKYVKRDLSLSNNRKLVSYEGFDNLKNVGRNLWLAYNTEITDFDHFKNVKEVNGFLVIEGHNYLKNLNFFDSLSYVGGSLMIRSNIALEKLGDFPKLQEIKGHFSIFDNSKLSQVQFSSLKKIEKSFSLNSLELIPESLKMDNLSEVGGNIEFGHSNFRNLDILINLKKVGGYTQLKYN